MLSALPISILLYNSSPSLLTMSLQCRFSVISDVGCVRTNNEDIAVLNGEFYRDSSDEGGFSIDESGRMLVAIADGMGGHNAGEVASEFVLRELDSFLVSLPEAMSESDLRNAMNVWTQQTHARLMQQYVDRPELDGMGTTLVGLFTYESRIWMMNVGDSRLYRWRGEVLRQLSTDHSLRRQQRDDTLPGNVIVNCFGAHGGSIYMDLEDITSRVLEEDCYLLCSDGLSDMLTDEEIEACLLRYSGSPKDVLQAAPSLVAAAKSAGGIDNITVLLLTVN